MIRDIERRRGVDGRRTAQEAFGSVRDWPSRDDDPGDRPVHYKAPLWALVGDCSTKWSLVDDVLESRDQP